MNDEIHRILIIGSGPAGLTAAIYAARAQLAPVVIEGIESGGQLLTTSDVENYPGFPEAVTGQDLMDAMRKQALRFGTVLIPEMVEKINFLEKPFRIWTDGQKILTARSIIIATGSSHKWLGLEAEVRLRGRGVSACATCDGYFFRGKEVIVVGGGDTAMEEALFLARLCSKVTIVHRRNQFRASKIMSDRVVMHPKITVIWDSVVNAIHGEAETTGVTGIETKNLVTGATETLECSGVFIAIGRNPNTKLFSGDLDIDRNGYLVTKPGTTNTSVEGVFACGEVQDNIYRQAITSAASGAMAAIDAEHWLEMCGYCG
ncbi:MAG: thioredoxin-disulfide reductase [Nitrospirae bacterium]|nr:thioredoxin-disulfide reductase [Nitrospirota bacterium]